MGPAKRKERDLEYEKNKRKNVPESGNNEESEKQSEGLRDDSIPESADQILPDENVEEVGEMEIGGDETSKAAKEAGELLQKEAEKSKND